MQTVMSPIVETVLFLPFLATYPFASFSCHAALARSPHMLLGRSDETNALALLLILGESSLHR